MGTHTQLTSVRFLNRDMCMHVQVAQRIEGLTQHGGCEQLAVKE